MVGYFKNNYEGMYAEGPFVATRVSGGLRVEVELKEWHCPVLPDSSIYDLMKIFGIDEVSNSPLCTHKERVQRIVDTLNLMVREGAIILEGNWWVFPKMAHKFRPNKMN